MELTDLQIQKLIIAHIIVICFIILWLITYFIWSNKRKDIVSFHAENLYKKNARIDVLTVKDTRSRVYLSKNATNIVVDKVRSNFVVNNETMNVVQYTPIRVAPRFYLFIRGVFIFFYVLSLILVLGMAVTLTIRLVNPEILETSNEYVIGFVNFMRSYLSFITFLVINAYCLVVILYINRLIDTYKMYKDSYYKMINTKAMSVINDRVYIDLDELKEQERYKKNTNKKKVKKDKKAKKEKKNKKDKLSKENK